MITQQLKKGTIWKTHRLGARQGTRFSEAINILMCGKACSKVHDAKHHDPN